MIKHIKTYSEFLNESHNDSHLLQTKEEIVQWLTSVRSSTKNRSFTGCTINDDLTVDVKGDVAFRRIGLTKSGKLPVRFGKVDGGVWVSQKGFKSLEGFPTYVGYNFDCSDNQLTSLEGCPTSVGGDFDCSNNKLTSLVGGPATVGRYFYCGNNKLTSLEGCPTEINGLLSCRGNELTSLLFAPKIDDVLFDINYDGNPCAEIYDELGLTIEAHVKALKTLDPDPADTLRRLKKYNPSLAKTLSLELGLEDEELTNVYNKVKGIEGGYF